MDNNELYHFGILGQKWGVRRFQDEDGTLTSAGKKRYSDKISKIVKKVSKKIFSIRSMEDFKELSSEIYSEIDADDLRSLTEVMQTIPDKQLDMVLGVYKKFGLDVGTAADLKATAKAIGEMSDEEINERLQQMNGTAVSNNTGNNISSESSIANANDNNVTNDNDISSKKEIAAQNYCSTCETYHPPFHNENFVSVSEAAINKGKNKTDKIRGKMATTPMSTVSSLFGKVITKVKSFITKISDKLKSIKL